MVLISREFKIIFGFLLAVAVWAYFINPDNPTQYTFASALDILSNVPPLDLSDFYISEFKLGYDPVGAFNWFVDFVNIFVAIANFFLAFVRGCIQLFYYAVYFVRSFFVGIF